MKPQIIFYKCKNCKDEINADTNSRLIYCKCGQMGIDGNKYYVRILGDGKTEIVKK